MKFLLMSDNHGSYSTVKTIVEAFYDQVDYIFHCGDSEFKNDDPIWGEFDGVVGGNMDFSPGYAQHQLIDTSAGKVLLIHGHKHGVKYGLEGILALTKEKKAKFVFYGHTHQLNAAVIDDIVIVNPGSLRQSRGVNPEKTFAIITTDGGSHKIDYFDETRNLLPHLTVEL